jgi:hypothetical protein
VNGVSLCKVPPSQTPPYPHPHLCQKGLRYSYAYCFAQTTVSAERLRTISNKTFLIMQSLPSFKSGRFKHAVQQMAELHGSLCSASAKSYRPSCTARAPAPSEKFSLQLTSKNQLLQPLAGWQVLEEFPVMGL